MTVTSWIQLATSLVLLLALLLSFFQLREIARQSRALRQSLQQAAYEATMGRQLDCRTAFLKDDPTLLQWFLNSRGYKIGSDVHNKQILFMIAKLDSHEAGYLQYSQGLFAKDLWEGWRQVLIADFEMQEFRDMWQVAKKFYAGDFVGFIEREILRPARPAVTARSPSPISSDIGGVGGAS